MTSENLGFAGVDLQSESACILLQIESHLPKIHDSMREEEDITSVVQVFEEGMEWSTEAIHILQTRQHKGYHR